MHDEDFNFTDIVNSAHEIIIVTEPSEDDITHHTIIYVNPAFTEITGYTAEEVVGKRARLVELFEDSIEKQNAIRESLEQRKPIREKVCSRTKLGKPLYLDMSIIPLNNKNGEPKYFASIERDVTKEIELIQQLEQISKTDYLTGLANRRALNVEVDKEFARTKRTHSTFSFLLLDLDHFKEINDIYGHAAGDIVLIEVACAMKENARQYDTPARTGGEEFCVLLPDVTLENAMHYAERLRRSIENLYIEYEGEKISITTSIGVVERTDRDISMEDIIDRADQAMYQAKHEGRNTIVMWSEAS